MTAEDEMSRDLGIAEIGCLAAIVIAIVGVVLLLSGCASHEVPVTTITTKEVKVPVSTPCVVNKPDKVVPLREQLTREQWDGLSTDQREKLLGAQALDHLIYGDKLGVATAGCR